MQSLQKKLFPLFVMLVGVLLFVQTRFFSPSSIPVVAIANYGPHETLADTIAGFKSQLQAEGFTEGEDVQLIMMDVGFQPALIPQMIAHLTAKKPTALVTLTTPVTQMAKGMVHDTPIVFAAIADPVATGVLAQSDQPHQNITGSSDQQNMDAFLAFAQAVMPDLDAIGLLYTSSESNDEALKDSLERYAQARGMRVVAVPVEQGRDIPVRMQALKGQVQALYVGHSGIIQPALPAIAAEAKKMRLPLFTADSQAVREGLALASHGVDFNRVGQKSARMVASILRGETVSSNPPEYPDDADHRAVIHAAMAKDYGVDVPVSTENLEVVQ